MSKITLVRTDKKFPEGQALEAARAFIYGMVAGATADDNLRWGKFWSKIKRLDPGEMFNIEIIFPRLTQYHRRHMKIEADIFSAQERFQDFEMFRDWLKIGAAWVKWVPGAKGGIVPLPKSVSYAKADQADFELYHRKLMEFLRGPHAAKYLWRHLADPYAMMEAILNEFNE